MGKGANLNWDELRKAIPVILDTMKPVLDEALEMVADLAESMPAMIPVPEVKIEFEDSDGRKCFVTISFVFEDTNMIGLLKSISLEPGEAVPHPYSKCLRCENHVDGLDRVLCPTCRVMKLS